MLIQSSLLQTCFFKQWSNESIPNKQAMSVFPNKQ